MTPPSQLHPAALRPVLSLPAPLRRVTTLAQRFWSVFAMLWLLTAVLAAGSSGALEYPDYVGSTACAECHGDATADWTASDHAMAWTLPTPNTVLGDFNNTSFEHGGRLTRFLRRGGRYLIETTGPDGLRRAYPVVGVAGVYPLQQYLLSPEPGRTQAYDIAWDVPGERWYPVFPDQVLVPATDGMHWTGPYLSWEARCAECHATGYSRNYIPETNSYSPKIAEIGVGCEACHGPGAAHIAWARSEDDAVSLPDMGLTVRLGASQQAEVMQCLTCHSRREAMMDGNPVPGMDYHDAFSMTLLREGVYYPDGSILDEVFEGGSFLQSKMFAAGMRCSTCHEPHSAKLRLEGNAVCAQCHSPAGNPDYPTLALRDYDDPAHHFHPPGSAGAQCVDCHMIERVYMGVDGRRDHSFRVPRPDLAGTGSPNACTDCHTDRSPDWAAAELIARFPDSAHRGPHFATTFSAAQREPGLHADALLEIAEWTNGPGIVRATALELVGMVADLGAADRVTALLADPDPMVRAAAAGPLRSLPAELRLDRLTSLLDDPLRSVREAAVKALADVHAIPGTAVATSLEQARQEWSNALSLRADFPETHLQIGGAALQAREFHRALEAFERAVVLDQQLVDAWFMIVRLHAALGDTDAARRALARGLAANPGDPSLLSLH